MRLRFPRLAAVASLSAALSVLTFAVPDSPTRAAAAPPPAQPAAAPSPLPRGPVLTGADGQPIKGVKLARAEVTAVVDGPLAEATMLLTFANDQPQVLGGELVFPLPEGATVTGYGLDVNGVMVDGVAVEKRRARIIYEQELHKRVDPGLVEHVAGNAFRTRLYPVPANGTRRVKVQYLPTVDLAGDQGDAPGKASLTLPVAWADVVDKVSIRVDVRGAAAAPVIAGAAGDQPGLKVEKAAGAAGFVVAGDVPTAALRDGFTVLLPALPNQSVSVQKRPRLAASIDEVEQQRADEKAGDAARTFGRSEHFFVLTDVPQAAAGNRGPLVTNRICVAWDASLSRADSDHARELKLLRELVARLGNPAVDVVVVRNELEVIPDLGGGGAGTDKLIETIRGLPYDGATDLGRLTLPKNLSDLRHGEVRQAVANYDLFLLFTDGMGNVGGPLPARADAPVYAISDDDRVNYPALRALCRGSGGAYFDLRKVADDQVITGVGYHAFSFVSAEFDPAQVAEVYPGPGTAINGRFALAGKLLVPEAKVKVNYGGGNRVSHSETFTVKADAATEGTLLPRFWAQQKVAELSLLPEKNAEELEKVGRQFNLVTPSTSLLVLETADQYVQYRVVPPKDRADVYGEFLAKIEQHKAAEQQSREQKLQQVAAAWQQRVEWWEKEYKYPADLKVQPEVLKDGAGVAVFGRTGGRPASAASAPPSPPPPAGAGSGSGTGGPPAGPALPEPTPTPAPAPEPAPVASPQPARQMAQQQPGQGRQPGRPAAGDDVASQPAGRVVEADARRAIRGEGAQLRDMDLRQMATDSRATVDSLTTRRKGDKEVEERGPVVGVTIKPWDPATPYLAAMKAAGPDKAYAVFLDQRKAFGRSPAFYLDCADYFVANGQRSLGIRALTDVAELQLQDARLLRVAAHRLMQVGERDAAIDLFEKVLALRPEEPQSYRDLALALADRADAVGPAAASRAMSDYTRALELLNKVVVGEWPRFPEVELPVLMEANAVAAKARRLPDAHDFRNPIDARLQKNLDCDVRVVLTWDADQTDIDLWVTEPSGEKCFYGHNRTIIGGLLSRDYTDGYGPEEYCLRKLMEGQFNVQANYYGSRQQELTGPATVQATVITDFGRPTEKRQALTVRLKDAREVVDLGAVTLGQGEPKAEPAPQPAPPAGPAK